MNTAHAVWDRVERGDDRECWEWIGARNHKGYGQIRVGGRQVAAHRAAYESAHGTAPGDLCVLHRCDNPPCCNPAHLFLGTHGDNNRDAAAKGRTRSGAKHPQAKLTSEQVAAIRRRRRDGERGVDLAAEYGVTPAAISCIHLGQTWVAA